MILPPVMLLTAGVVATAVVATLVVREWRRVKGLDRAKTAPVARTQRDAIPRLRRDPVTGIYRP